MQSMQRVWSRWALTRSHGWQQFPRAFFAHLPESFCLCDLSVRALRHLQFGEQCDLASGLDVDDELVFWCCRTVAVAGDVHALS